MDASAFSNIGRAIGLGFKVAAILLCISVPLAMWKLIDIAIWACRHVHIHLG